LSQNLYDIYNKLKDGLQTLWRFVVSCFNLWSILGKLLLNIIIDDCPYSFTGLYFILWGSRPFVLMLPSIKQRVFD
jgi:hypothetical protein